MPRVLLIYILCLCGFALQAQTNTLKIAKLKYQGGGDWYANKTALPNLIAFCNQELNMSLAAEEDVVEVGSKEIFYYPYLYMTGHGNVFFTQEESENLRDYLLSGGFLHIDDNYGMEPYVKRELLKVFPDKQLEELGADHPIFNQKYSFFAFSRPM